MAVGHERTHAEFLGQDEGLLVVGFSLHDIGRIGVGMDNAKLVQRERLIAAVLLLPGQVERLARVLQGLCTVSLQTTALAESGPADRTTRICADTFADRLLQQRAPFRVAPLERIGIAQACDDHWRHVAVVRGTRQGQALVTIGRHAQVHLGEGQVAEAAVSHDRGEPSACPLGKAERLLCVAPALGEAPQRAQGPRQVRLGLG
jgi:hypothetical protein